jgi:hypothetical protein
VLFAEGARRREQHLLDLLEEGRRGACGTVERNGGLAAVVAPDERGPAGRQLPRAQLDPNRDALQLPVDRAAPERGVGSGVEVRTDARGAQLRLDSPCRCGDVALLVQLHDHQLVRCDRRGQA